MKFSVEGDVSSNHMQMGRARQGAQPEQVTMRKQPRRKQPSFRKWRPRMMSLARSRGRRRALGDGVGHEVDFAGLQWYSSKEAVFFEAYAYISGEWAFMLSVRAS